jgi:surface antigen
VYAHDYVYADDPFYSDCRYDPVVGNTIMGAILGGFFGNVVSGGRSDATISGMIFGGAAAASLSQDLNCEDRYFVYRTYFDAFNRGIPRTAYQWSNPRTGRYGTLFVGDYYRDIDGYFCATYNQDTFIRGRRMYTGGHACSQNDGTWVMID